MAWVGRSYCVLLGCLLACGVDGHAAVLQLLDTVNSATQFTVTVEDHKNRKYALPQQTFQPTPHNTTSSNPEQTTRAAGATS
jgi:hypothetical protein